MTTDVIEEKKPAQGDTWAFLGGRAEPVKPTVGAASPFAAFARASAPDESDEENNPMVAKMVTSESDAPTVPTRTPATEVAIKQPDAASQAEVSRAIEQSLIDARQAQLAQQPSESVNDLALLAMRRDQSQKNKAQEQVRERAQTTQVPGFFNAVANALFAGRTGAAINPSVSRLEKIRLGKEAIAIERLESSVRELQGYVGVFQNTPAGDRAKQTVVVEAQMRRVEIALRQCSGAMRDVSPADVLSRYEKAIGQVDASIDRIDTLATFKRSAAFDAQTSAVKNALEGASGIAQSLMHSISAMFSRSP